MSPLPASPAHPSAPSSATGPPELPGRIVSSRSGSYLAQIQIPLPPAGWETLGKLLHLPGLRFLSCKMGKITIPVSQGGEGHQGALTGRAQHSTWQAGSTQKVSFPGKSFSGPSHFLLALSLVPDRLGPLQPPPLPPSPIRALSQHSHPMFWGVGTPTPQNAGRPPRLSFSPVPSQPAGDRGEAGTNLGTPWAAWL